MNAVSQVESLKLPAPVERRGIPEAAWRTLMNNLYPGAKPESVCMVWDYCIARKLDPLKKPCHIVSMPVRMATGEDEWRDIVLPGIYEYRTTAARTFQYLGHSKPEYGEWLDFLGVSAPEYCDLTIYRWNGASNSRAEYPVRVYFREVCATRWDKVAKEQKVNARWTRAPVQMLTKCTEAAGLREGFPDEIGGVPTAEEMFGQRSIDDDGSPKGLKISVEDGITDDVDFEVRDKHVSSVADILAQDKEELDIAVDIQNFVSVNLANDYEMHIAVMGELARRKILTKSAFTKLCAMKDERPL